jgi:hypothetical protein
MLVYASRFLEGAATRQPEAQEEWTWTPYDPDSSEIFASGRSTNSRESTYQGEKDDRADIDRPNEGLLEV